MMQAQTNETGSKSSLKSDNNHFSQIVLNFDFPNYEKCRRRLRLLNLRLLKPNCIFSTHHLSDILDNFGTLNSIHSIDTQSMEKMNLWNASSFGNWFFNVFFCSSKNMSFVTSDDGWIVWIAGNCYFVGA